MTWRVPSLLAALLSTLVACARGERAAATAETAAAATARPADTVATQSPAPPTSGTPAAQGGPITADELRRYVLTLDRVREMHRASMEWARVAPNRGPGGEDDPRPGAVGDANRMLAMLQRSPDVARAINAAEMTTRQVAVHFTVLAAAAAAAARGGPPPPEIAPENVTFAKGHMPELERMRNERDAIMRTTMP